MSTETIRRLRPTRDDVEQILLALVKTRSVAAEGGYLDLMAGKPGLEEFALETWTANDQTVQMVSDLASWRKPLEPQTWLNLAYLIDRSAAWGLGLIVREVRMPTPAEALEDVRHWAEVAR